MKIKKGQEIFLNPFDIPDTMRHLSEYPWLVIEKKAGVYLDEWRWVVELAEIDSKGKITYNKLSILEEAVCGVFNKL